jgi:(2R)-ethylmalonyl-CoA mutase
MIARQTISLLHERGARDVKLIMGGIIPEHDRAELIGLGVRAVFTPSDSRLDQIVGRIIAIADEEERVA